jgi:ribosomal protein S18 acetylase RimI-like enzyme
MLIRRVVAGDAASLEAFYNGLSERSKRTFRPLGETTTLAVCQGIVRDNQNELKLDLVAVRLDAIVGWSFVWGLTREPTLGLCVSDSYQGQGLGGRLLDRVLEVSQEYALSEIHLTVVQDNLVALRLYEERGFVRNGELVGGDGLDYYRMVAQLRTEP